MNRLIFRSDQWTELCSQILSTAPSESAAALIIRSGKDKNNHRLIVQKALHPEPDEYLKQTPQIASLAPGFVARALKSARLMEGSLIFVHSHPHQQTIRFSNQDEFAQRELAPTLFARAPTHYHGSAVVGPNGFLIRLFDRGGETVAMLDRIMEVGPTVRQYETKISAEPYTQDYFDRNVRAFGQEGQARLLTLRVAVVGVGGTGSIVVEELSRLGIGKLLLIDPEVVEETNLNRLFGARAADVGRPKVDVARDVALNARADMEIEVIADSVLFEGVARSLLDCDFVFCCTDSHGSRAILNQLAYQYGIPMIDVGIRIDAHNEVIRGINTRVQMLSPGLPCLNCHPLLNPVAIRQDLLEDKRSDPYIVGFHEPQPAVISINAVASSSAVTMFLAAYVGFPSEPRHLLGRPMEGVTRPVVSQANPSCVVCAPDNALFKGDSWPMIWLPQ